MIKEEVHLDKHSGIKSHGAGGPPPSLPPALIDACTIAEPPAHITVPLRGSSLTDDNGAALPTSPLHRYNVSSASSTALSSSPLEFAKLRRRNGQVPCRAVWVRRKRRTARYLMRSVSSGIMQRMDQEALARTTRNLENLQNCRSDADGKRGPGSKEDIPLRKCSSSPALLLEWGDNDVPRHRVAKSEPPEQPLWTSNIKHSLDDIDLTVKASPLSVKKSLGGQPAASPLTVDVSQLRRQSFAERLQQFVFGTGSNRHTSPVPVEGSSFVQGELDQGGVGTVAETEQADDWQDPPNSSTPPSSSAHESVASQYQLDGVYPTSKESTEGKSAAGELPSSTSSWLPTLTDDDRAESDPVQSASPDSVTSPSGVVDSLMSRNHTQSTLGTIDEQEGTTTSTDETREEEVDGSCGAILPLGVASIVIRSSMVKEEPEGKTSREVDVSTGSPTPSLTPRRGSAYQTDRSSALASVETYVSAVNATILSVREQAEEEENGRSAPPLSSCELSSEEPQSSSLAGAQSKEGPRRAPKSASVIRWKGGPGRSSRVVWPPLPSDRSCRSADESSSSMTPQELVLEQLQGTPAARTEPESLLPTVEFAEESPCASLPSREPTTEETPTTNLLALQMYETSTINKAIPRAEEAGRPPPLLRSEVRAWHSEDSPTKDARLASEDLPAEANMEKFSEDGSLLTESVDVTPSWRSDTEWNTSKSLYSPYQSTRFYSYETEVRSVDDSKSLSTYHGFTATRSSETAGRGGYSFSENHASEVIFKPLKNCLYPSDLLRRHMALQTGCPPGIPLGDNSETAQPFAGWAALRALSAGFEASPRKEGYVDAAREPYVDRTYARDWEFNVKQVHQVPRRVLDAASFFQRKTVIVFPYAYTVVVEQIVNYGAKGLVLRARRLPDSTSYSIDNVQNMDHGKPEDDVVLKVVYAHPDEVQQIMSEACLQAELDHPNVCKHLGSFFILTSWIVLVQEYLPGSLRKLYTDFGPLPEPVIASLVRGVLRGLQYLHEGGGRQRRRLIHMDVKSTNALVGYDGLPRLVDFGLTQVCDERDILYGRYGGTVMWLAPENARGLLSERRIPKSQATRPFDHSSDSDRDNSNQDNRLPAIGTKADIWSVGVVMLELFAGRLPVDSLGDPEIAKILSSPRFEVASLFDLPALLEGSSRNLREAVERCLVVNPNERASAAELLSLPFFRNAPTPKPYFHLFKELTCIAEAGGIKRTTPLSSLFNFSWFGTTNSSTVKRPTSKSVDPSSDGKHSSGEHTPSGELVSTTDKQKKEAYKNETREDQEAATVTPSRQAPLESRVLEDAPRI